MAAKSGRYTARGTAWVTEQLRGKRTMRFRGTRINRACMKRATTAAKRRKCRRALRFRR